MNTYPEGSTVRVNAIFSEDGISTSPTTLELHIDGPQTELVLSITDVTSSSPGSFQYDIVNVVAGIYKYYWRGTAGVLSWSGDLFEVVAFKKGL